jgi:hypothetical protein
MPTQTDILSSVAPIPAEATQDMLLAGLRKIGSAQTMRRSSAVPPSEMLQVAWPAMLEQAVIAAAHKTTDKSQPKPFWVMGVERIASRRARRAVIVCGFPFMVALNMLFVALVCPPWIVVASYRALRNLVRSAREKW